MQDSIDEYRRALKSVPEYERHAKPAVEAYTQAVILPECKIRSSLVLHPVILKYNLDSKKVYKAMLKLLEFRKNESKKEASSYGTYFTCCTCGVESPFVPENRGVTCPVCGMSQAGYISYDNPYREFEGEETRDHWSDTHGVRKDYEKTLERWTAIQHFSTCFPKLGSNDLDAALQCVNELSSRDGSIRNLNVVAAAALLVVDNPDILSKRQIRIVEPEKPSYACKMCGRSYFDNKTAKHCCESKGIYKRDRNCQNSDVQTWLSTDDVIVKVSRCNLFSYSKKRY